MEGVRVTAWEFANVLAQFGDEEIGLRLGIDVHRSHKTLITSQVSEVPAELSGLWSK